MNPKFLIIAFVVLNVFIKTYGQAPPDTTKVNPIIAFREELNGKFKDPAKTPLKREALVVFKELDFFPVDLNYCVMAKFIRTPNSDTIKMKTSTDRTPDYLKYAELHFNIDSKKYILNVYQNLQLSKTEEYRNYLFLPFKDLTNGNESYGGGRYIDLTIPEGKKIVLDFNKSYNPLCAYNDIYSCPVPPPENFLELEIKAGVKYWGKH